MQQYKCLLNNISGYEQQHLATPKSIMNLRLRLIRRFSRASLQGIQNLLRTLLTLSIQICLEKISDFAYLQTYVPNSVKYEGLVPIQVPSIVHFSHFSFITLYSVHVLCIFQLMLRIVARKKDEMRFHINGSRFRLNSKPASISMKTSPHCMSSPLLSAFMEHGPKKLTSWKKTLSTDKYFLNIQHSRFTFTYYLPTCYPEVLQSALTFKTRRCIDQLVSRTTSCHL